jgi:hypothetical protein
MIRPIEALNDLDHVFDEYESEPGFTRIQSSKNRTMPVRSHSSTNNGRRRTGAKRTKVKVGMQRRYNKKVLHNN